MITLALRANSTICKAMADYQKILLSCPKEQNFNIRASDNDPKSLNILTKIIYVILSTTNVMTLKLSNLGNDKNVLEDIEISLNKAMVSKGVKLTTLDLSHNNIKDEEVVILLKILQTIKTISKCDISDNKITKVSKEYLDAFNKEKVTLDLSHNPLNQETQELLGSYEYIKFADSA